MYVSFTDTNFRICVRIIALNLLSPLGIIIKDFMHRILGIRFQFKRNIKLHMYKKTIISFLGY